MNYWYLIILCFALMSVFIYFEFKKKYGLAVLFKGLASAVFILFGYLSIKITTDTTLFVFNNRILIGLILGGIADICLNLRFVFKKNGSIVFLIGILFFMAGHVLYVLAQCLFLDQVWWLILIAVALTAITLFIIFKFIDAKTAFKAFGVLYIGAIMIMTVLSIAVLINRFDVHNILFVVGAISFLASDIVLIVNTFGNLNKKSLRITNLSLYYLGQLLIGLSLQFLL